MTPLPSRNDISEDEIRVIGPRPVGPRRPRAPRFRRRRLLWGAGAVSAALAVVAFLFMQRPGGGETPAPGPAPVRIGFHSPAAGCGSVSVCDTVAGGVRLRLLYPLRARPALVAGNDVLADSSLVLAVPAADVRSDNGQVAGACVVGGELVSRGRSKSGYCAVIEGSIYIGKAESTPLFEKATETGGGFFRQYSLVVGGQVVGNRPRGRALRKALVQIGGRIVVAVSPDALTLRDFSQALADAGATTAIYLTGSSAYGFYVEAGGRRVALGSTLFPPGSLATYLVWR